LGALFAFGVISPVHAADVAAGRAKAMFTCAECHGAAGVSVVANFPNLAGQKELYLVTQLKAFRAGKRRNIEMNLIAKPLSDADIANVAAYFAGLPCAAK
jgi:cytochrome c553